MGERLDAALVARGLARSRAVAREAVEGGHVRLNGVACRRPSRQVEDSDELEVGVQPRFVGRGGLKLDAALEHFGISVEGARCLDVGASTGGFTDCLLQRGAREVVAVDVGHGQIVAALKEDPRVHCYEGINIRDTPPAPWNGSFDRIVVDVSFIPLNRVLPSVWKWAGPGCVVILLVKPQFECGKDAVGKSGIVRDPAARTAAVAGVRELVEAEKAWKILGVIPSPIDGTDGNREFLLAAVRQEAPCPLSGLASPPPGDKVEP